MSTKEVLSWHTIGVAARAVVAALTAVAVLVIVPEPAQRDACLGALREGLVHVVTGP